MRLRDAPQERRADLLVEERAEPVAAAHVRAVRERGDARLVRFTGRGADVAHRAAKGRVGLEVARQRPHLGARPLARAKRRESQLLEARQRRVAGLRRERAERPGRVAPLGCRSRGRGDGAGRGGDGGRRRAEDVLAPRLPEDRASVGVPGVRARVEPFFVARQHVLQRHDVGPDFVERLEVSEQIAPAPRIWRVDDGRGRARHDSRQLPRGLAVVVPLEFFDGERLLGVDRVRQP
mmetsp:Transcript_25876/g.77951  ORF Transcript_25876/g.77951 Transcript_25876/m.77951 type:complete len:236 (+) Transcript_25876:882-1589(+)